MTSLDDRIERLEDKIRFLEQVKAALRKHLNRPPLFFDRYEAIELLETLVTLVRLTRTQAHDKADEYSAALDEVKSRQASLDPAQLQRLLLGLVGDPLSAKMGN